MRKKYLLNLLLLSSFGLLVNSCGNKGMKPADDATDYKKFNTAATLYKEVYTNSTDKDEKKLAAFKAGESYREAANFKQAEIWYLKSVKMKGVNTTLYEAQLRYAQMIKISEKYPEAIVEFQNYLKLVPDDTVALAEIKGCELALQWKGEKTRYIVENFGLLNTKEYDFSPMYYPNNTKVASLYFTSDRAGGIDKKPYEWTGKSFTDLWKTDLTKGTRNRPAAFAKPILVPEINSKFNDGVCTFDAKGNTMYFTLCNGVEGKEKTCKIYSATKTKDGWGEIDSLPFTSSEYSTGHPSLSIDGSRLYFSSDMPGGYGGKDIWYVTFVRKGKTWSEPVNLGPKINTAGQEMYPYVHNDGTLYFSSNGLMGIGGLDMFSTTWTGQDWTEPENLKYPLNSGGDDFGIVMEENKEKGYFTSNRLDSKYKGKGLDDIYSFRMEPLLIDITGIVTDCNTKEILVGAKVYMTNSKDTTKMMAVTDDAGSYRFQLQPGVDYELHAAFPEDYYLDSKNYYQTTKGIEFTTTLIQNFCLEFQIFTIQGIYYGLDSANIRPASALILDSLVNVLKTFPKLTIELGSHTDCRADSLYNINLSQRRADSAVAYIVTHGIDAERLVAKGYGENQLFLPQCVCDLSDTEKLCSEAEHQLNRRTTVRITGKHYQKAPRQGPKPPVKGQPQKKPAPPPQKR
jgi:peptidoglycan-associated lipoprotein